MADVRDMLGLSAQQQPAPSSSSSSSMTSPAPPHIFASPSPPQHGRMKRHSSTASPSPSASSLSSPHHPSLHRARSTRPSVGPSSSSSAFSASSSSAGRVVAPLAPSRLVIPSTGEAQRWVNAPIRSSARRAATGLSHDDVDLLHWVKAKGEADYRFSRFHRHIKLRQYTGEQYDAHLIDPDWTRQETDALMALCAQLDLRFVVVADRYNDGAASAHGGRERSVEELKGRYYGVQCKLLQLQNASDPELRKHPLFTSSYDEEYERKRKEQLALLYKRRVRDVEEMGQAVLELRKVQNQMKRLKKSAREAREAQRASRGDGGGSGGVAASPGGTVSLSHKSHRKKHRHSSSSAASLLLPIPDNQLAAIPDNLLPPAALNPPASLSAQTPFLRSAQFALSVSSLPAKAQKAVLADVAALGVAGVKELVPTAPVWEMWERVRLGAMQWRAMEQLVEERDKVRDELREEERRKGNAAAAAAGGGAGEVKREKGASSSAALSSSSSIGGEEKRKDKKVKKERREGGGGDEEGSGAGLGGEKGEKVSVSHRKKDRDSKRKGGDGDERDSKRRKK